MYLIKCGCAYINMENVYMIEAVGRAVKVNGVQMTSCENYESARRLVEEIMRMPTLQADSYYEVEVDGGSGVVR